MRFFIRSLIPLALLLGFLIPATAATAAPAQNFREETLAFTINDCNEEPVFMEGTYRQVSKTQKDGKTVYTDTLHVKGVGTQGNEYVLNGTSHFRTNVPEFDNVSSFTLISKGSAPNLIIHARLSSNHPPVITGGCRG